jgi:hypothetical protein
MEVIHSHHLMAIVEKTHGQIRAEEASRACDEVSHQVSSKSPLTFSGKLFVPLGITKIA